ncbi:regulator of G-protein signaling 22 [Phasianus colchicus]|uniref:Regulator of G protein signaling 22 n=1 Tax=Phasianus colchicus TaxID=9054 RepID=A0A669PAJ1_PHACC|nr:regulator of G-protein signaling 22 [Phasianus colchicus]XP_031446922.1 regulator of G-protein signaling 22 [Phasianus colchicus]
MCDVPLVRSSSMQSKKLTTEPPCITEEVFEDYLATDAMLVDYFNEFLSLPTFAQPVKFNSDFGVFEVLNDIPQRMEHQLKKILHDQKPPNPIYDVIRKAKNDGQNSKKISDSSALSFDPNYNTMCLDREQAVQWIKKERLPAFLESDCYFEYRLAKLISQVEWSQTGINFIIDSTYYPWIRKEDASTPSAEEDGTLFTMKRFYVSLGQATVSQTMDWFTLAKGSESMKTTDSFMRPAASVQIQDTQHLPGLPERKGPLSEKASCLEAGSLSKEYDHCRFRSSSRTSSTEDSIFRERSRESEEGSSMAISEPPSYTQLGVYLDQNLESTAEEGSGQENATLQLLEELIPSYTQFVTKESISELTRQPPDETESDVDFPKQPKMFIHELSNNEFARGTEEPLLSQSSSPFTVMDSMGDMKERDAEEVSLRSSSESNGADSRAAWCINHRTYDTGNRNEFERFKKFIKGTLGERYWWLWMDIERLKVLKDTTRQQRQLDKMKKLYLLSCGDYFLTSEVLLRLDLLHGDQWNTRHLRQIQPEVVKPLLLYWGPRFCVTHSTAIETASARLKFWHTCQERPRVDTDPFPQMVSLLPLTTKSCMPRIPPSLPQGSSRLSSALSSRQSSRRDDFLSSRNWPESVSRDTIHCLALDETTETKHLAHRRYTYAELLPGKSAAGSVILRGSRMENMLQSLYLENRAGYYFTHFCEKSGNKLWKNSAYFWSDLQAYHQLFYQETLHPFKICRQAQFLYATYIAPSASMDIGLHQSKKNMIYQKMDPAFEDLFDIAEEHILLLLLEPWMKMVEADKYTYGKVELVEETRQLDSVYFRKLQALHQESVSKKNESTVADTDLPSFPDVLKEAQHLHQASKKLTGSNLYDLIHNKQKLEQFWVFLNEHSAGMDLMCWLDIEQFRRMLHRDKEKREEKSKEIKNKYLNKKYFFGPNSPATREQQEQLMHSGGGWGQILHDQLPPAVLLEIQHWVQKRLEEQWLPLFLADEQQGAEGQAKVRDKTEDILRQKQKTTRTWKHVDNKRVSSSSEIIAFRKALLDPVTANQFQCFVSLKGDLLENGVLFWQEVQKYKDLCHSHCDDATVQNKITTIIDRFINSTVPPALQIDIPTEQAQKILEHRKELGPYIFREAQMTVFALLFKFWPKFCEFQSRLPSDKIVHALERKKGKRMQTKEGKISAESLTKFQGKEVASSALEYQADVERRSTSFLDAYGYGYEWQASWSYSKYIEALEQERVLLKMQEDLEKNSSSLFTGTSSMSFPKPENSENCTISPKNSVTSKKHSDLPKETENRLKSP